MPREMIVVPYRAEWRRLYDAEKSLIEGVMKDRLVAVHHIGSTAVEGLAAKPVIDILVVVNDLSDVDDQVARFQGVGYECKGEFGIKGRRFLRKGGDENPTRHIHAFRTGDRNIRRHLAFRDYLRAFPKIRDEYGRIKLNGAALHRYDSDGYMGHKDLFVKQTEKLALSWYETIA
ncbi:MAG: GrpB family protein [Vicinamibacteria bacterium]|nr:GrpB family protein [Vicinamibacteria bacterium]